MTIKSTLKYVRTTDFMFHLYHDIKKGYAIDIQYKKFSTTLLIDEEQSLLIKKQLESDV